MARTIPEEELKAIESVVSGHPEGVAIQGIQKELGAEMTRRTIQFRLRRLVDMGRLAMEGERRGVRYLLPSDAKRRADARMVSEADLETQIPLSTQAIEVQELIRRPLLARKPVPYQREFLDSYIPNVSFYLSAKERARLHEIGSRAPVGQPAGTYARQIMNRLLIDLSWNSSRLEGNTYSLLDTKRLLAFGVEAEGKSDDENNMILNHKAAIQYLVDSAGTIGFNRRTILGLHNLLSHNLLDNEGAAGRLRVDPVGIGQCVYHPPENSLLIEECFDRILFTAEAIDDPFEQAFFIMAQLPYLQPFMDVNKRVSRLAANIPLFKANLTPLSFTEVPAKTYTDALLAVYELNRTELLRDVFMWAFERSAARYALVRRTVGKADTFGMKHRMAVVETVRSIVLEKLDRKSAFSRIDDWSAKNIKASERDKFRELAENAVLAIDESACPRYSISPSQLEEWQDAWNDPGR